MTSHCSGAHKARTRELMAEIPHVIRLTPCDGQWHGVCMPMAQVLSHRSLHRGVRCPFRRHRGTAVSIRPSLTQCATSRSGGEEGGEEGLRGLVAEHVMTHTVAGPPWARMDGDVGGLRRSVWPT